MFFIAPKFTLTEPKLPLGEEVTADSRHGLSQKAISLMVYEFNLSQLKAKTEELRVVKEVARLASLVRAHG